MKHLKLAMIFLCLAMMGMVTMEAEAGWLKKSDKKERTEKPEEMSVPHRFDRNPNMVFMGGTLSQDPLSGWKIGDTPLYLGKKCVITMAGADKGTLEEGREAVVMGVKVGEAISAWSIQVAPLYTPMQLDSGIEPEMEPGDNPNVGRYTGPVD
jgi:hypothetical protein